MLGPSVDEEDWRAGSVVSEVDRDIFECYSEVFPVVEWC